MTKYMTASMTAASTYGELGECAMLTLPEDAASATIVLSGTWVGTVQFEASNDGGKTWAAIYGYPFAASTPVTSSTATGSWNFNVASKTNLRARASAYTSGTIEASVASSPADFSTVALNTPQDLSTSASPTFVGETLTGNTAKAFLYSDASKAVVSTAAPTNGQLLVGSTGAVPVVAALTGTTNQLTVTNGAGSITLSTPQDTHTSATPRFARLGLGVAAGATAELTLQNGESIDNVDNGVLRAITGTLDVNDRVTLGSESAADDSDFSQATWTLGAEFAVAGTFATYTFAATGAGTITQASGDLAVAGVGNRWYKLVYVVSAAPTVVGATVTVTTGFAAAAVALDVTAGSHTVYLKSKNAPGDFVIDVTGASAGAFTIESVSLKEVTGGNIAAAGKFTGGGTSGLDIGGDGSVIVDSLTASTAIYSDANKKLTSLALTNGQLMVGSTGAIPVAAAITGTADQVSVAVGAGTITLSTPQSINTTSTPQFARLGLGAAADATAELNLSNGETIDNAENGIVKILGPTMEVSDRATLGSESTADSADFSQATWTLAAEFAVAGTFATYTYAATGAGTVTQASGDLAVAGVGSRWYKLVYVISAAPTVTDATVTVTTGFAASAVALDVSAGSHTVYFRSKASPGDFVIDVTGATAGAFTIESVSLKEVTGGNVVAMGKFTGGGTTGIGVASSGAVAIDSTVDSYNGIATVANGVPSEYAQLNLTAQDASIGSTTIYANPASDALYRISYYLYISVTGNAETVLVTFGWTDPATNAKTLASATVSGDTAGDMEQGSIIVYADASTNLTYSTTVSGALGTGKYVLIVRVEKL